MKLNEKLYFVRKRKNMTLKEVADIAGKSISFLSDIERGRTHPSMSTFFSLAKAYNQNVSQLMSGVDEL